LVRHSPSYLNTNSSSPSCTRVSVIPSPPPVIPNCADSMSVSSRSICKVECHGPRRVRILSNAFVVLSQKALSVPPRYSYQEPWTPGISCRVLQAIGTPGAKQTPCLGAFESLNHALLMMVVKKHRDVCYVRAQDTGIYASSRDPQAFLRWRCCELLRRVLQRVRC